MCCQSVCFALMDVVEFELELETTTCLTWFLMEMESLQIGQMNNCSNNFYYFSYLCNEVKAPCCFEPSTEETGLSKVAIALDHSRSHFWVHLVALSVLEMDY